MKRIFELLFVQYLFFIVFGGLFASEEPSQLHYTIQPLVNEKKLLVTLTFKGDGSGVTELSRSLSWTGEPYEEIGELEFYSEDKTLVVDEGHTLEVIRLTHKPHADIVLKYDVTPLTDEDSQLGIVTAYSQEQSYFRFTGDCVFIAPEYDLYEKRKITLEWIDLPSNWVLANSYGMDKAKQELHTTLFSLYMSLYVGGEFAIQRCWDSEKAPYVATMKEESFPKEQIIPLLKTIIQNQRQFWKDEDFPHFLIVLLPKESEDEIHAEAKLNAFFVHYSPFEFGLDADASKFLSWVLCHEHFHTWNPFKMMPRALEDFDSLAWFIEGFTEYYTAAICYRSEILDLNECIDEINHMLYGYNTSPFKTVKNDHFREERWGDIQMQLLAYQRGCLLALLWDAKIRERTSGKHSLDDVMRNILKKVHETGSPLSIEHIQESAGEYLGQEAMQDVKAYIMDGALIIPPEHPFESSCTLFWDEDVEFNLFYAQKTGVIRGVVEDSHAYEAGLRNLHELKEFHRNDDGSVTVIVDDDLEELEIQYTPASKEMVPHYDWD